MPVWIAILLPFVSAFATDPAEASTRVAVIFMEPADDGASPPLYRKIEDAEQVAQYKAWLNNESARLGLDLFALGWAAVGKAADAPPYAVAVVPGGNHADVGFRLKTGEKTEDFSDRSYIKLAPNAGSFRTTFLHETGHVVLATLLNGRRFPARGIASIPHSTSALTNRGTAFNEGFAISLETLAAHIANDPELRKKYHRLALHFGSESGRGGEYYRHAVDVATYAQNLARYDSVRDNEYAFASAFNGPDYLRVQLERPRNFAQLRDANQLLQSEGFHASFFFALTMRGEQPDAETIRLRQRRMLKVLKDTFDAHPPTSESPTLLDFVSTYVRKHPQDAAEVVDVFLDLSRGVFVDAQAADLWKRWYLGAVRLDIQNLPTAEIEAARERWRTAVLRDPAVLYSRVGPQLACEVPSREVLLVAFGQAAPLAFDLNTVQEGIIKWIPGVSADEASRWLLQRALRPYADFDDFTNRAKLSEQVLSVMNFITPPSD